jgi:UDP:flavonoid glycosyltransferase YjiC (YdhE family)
MTNHQQTANPRILVAPLDWGLGHATRCIPIIRELVSAGADVILAGEGNAETILRTEFPSLKFVPLQGYRITYGKNKIDLVGKILLQIPRILASIEAENSWLEKLVSDYNVDAVISDNRYGLYNKKVYSVFITHQLQIKTGLAITDRLLEDINYNHIRNFDVCWVPDTEGKPSLAGQLSHPKRKPAIPVDYIGWQSRFDKEFTGGNKHILVVLSGPEPQRTLLEEMIVNQLNNYDKPVVFVRGLPGDISGLDVPDNVSVFNHLGAKALEEKISGASFVIARCGYSTLMDLLPLKKKTILIPTPGQTEQEYLAQHLTKNCFALCVEQQHFHLSNLLDLASAFPYQFPAPQKENPVRGKIATLLLMIGQKLVNEREH